MTLISIFYLFDNKNKKKKVRSIEILHHCYMIYNLLGT